MSFDEDEEKFNDRHSDKDDFYDISDNDEKEASGSEDDFFKDEDFDFGGYKDEGTEGEGFRTKRIKQRKKKRKVVFRIIAIMFILILVAAGAVFGYRYIKNRFFSPAEIPEEEGISIPTSLELGEDINVVIACAGENLLEPEVSSIVFSSYYSSEEKLISLCMPVKTLMDVPGFNALTVGEAVGKGGMDLLSLTLENNLGMDMEIDYYILLDIYNIVNKLDGIDLELDEEITVNNYDDGSTFKLEKGNNLIDGAEAVNFLKYFSGMEKDVPTEDIVKQKALLDAIIDKIVGESEESLSGNLNLVKDFMDTDLSMEERLKIFSTFSSIEADKNLSYPLDVSPTELAGVGIVYVMQDISELAEIFSKEGTADGEDTGFTETVKITILNGAYDSLEASGLAAKASETLEGLKFEDGTSKYEIVEVKNSDNIFESTQILVYSQDENALAAADDIKAVLGVGSISVGEDELIDLDIVVILGTDYVEVSAGPSEGEVEGELLKIIVLNGEGTTGLAATVNGILEEYLNAEEETVVMLEQRSADNFNYTQTEIVIFTSTEGVNEIAQKIQERLGVGVIEYSDNNVDNVDISVTLGSDYTNQ